MKHSMQLGWGSCSGTTRGTPNLTPVDEEVLIPIEQPCVQRAAISAGSLEEQLGGIAYNQRHSPMGCPSSPMGEGTNRTNGFPIAINRVICGVPCFPQGNLVTCFPLDSGCVFKHCAGALPTRRGALKRVPRRT